MFAKLLRALDPSFGRGKKMFWQFAPERKYVHGKYGRVYRKLDMKSHSIPSL